MPKTSLSVPVESRILVLREQRVILDTDLAELYGVPVKRLNEQVKTQSGAVPRGFHVPADCGRKRIFEVARCDLKNWPGRPSLRPLRLYRAWGDYGGHGAEFRAG